MTQSDFILAAVHSETDDCVLWPYKVTKEGYPRYTPKYLGKRLEVRANRFVCVAAHGSPPAPGSHAAHSCGVRRCINPRHLRWASPQANVDDMLLHGTHASQRANLRKMLGLSGHSTPKVMN